MESFQIAVAVDISLNIAFELKNVTVSWISVILAFYVSFSDAEDVKLKSYMNESLSLSTLIEARILET